MQANFLVFRVFYLVYIMNFQYTAQKIFNDHNKSNFQNFFANFSLKIKYLLKI